MDVMTTARAIGLTSETGDVFGTIDEVVVIEALLELSAHNPGHGDLFAGVVAQVQRCRSAGVEKVTSDSVFARFSESREIQLRYRAEMAELFSDLAIDLGLERAAALEPVPTV